MSSVLTENVVLVRTRSHDLNSVKKLNCWGCTLEDVSIVNRMPNVEVISLSINRIDTLKYFASCTLLQELYLRKNEIEDINEILHLSQLQFLKKLSLEDNPCTNVDNYRLTILKALPNLEFLDNVKVTAEELYQAEKLGRELIWPGTETVDDIGDEIIENTSGNVQYDMSRNYSETKSSYPVLYQEQVSNNSNNSSSSNSSNCQTVTLSNGLTQQQTNEQYHQQQQSSMNVGGYIDQQQLNNSGSSENGSTNSVINSSSSSSLYGNNNNTSTTNGNRNNYQPQPPPTPMMNGGNNSSSNLQHHLPQANIQKSASPNNNNHHNNKKTNMAKANSLSDYNIYSTNGNFRCSSPALSGNPYEPIEYGYENGQNILHNNNNNNTGQSSYYMPNVNSTRANLQSASSTSNREQQQQQRILPKGGRNRNANILSAVLCLIKELDYGSLEVVDTTIHCRMEEMED
ncbi:LOW QUALITY PROTEIN: uncharacterized protein LOC124495798 [Dermatophagoides farinae]|uniref:LOW QUALITY PROTEIN: uncharacterized protein LOC124495798 n=1 Tax=Dermatophagoides farinae TaxID=6954 RepID=UPI003F5F077E